MSLNAISRKSIYFCLFLFLTVHSSYADVSGLILDLDADRGVTLEDGNNVSVWQNQVASFPGRDFVKRDENRKPLGSGRPKLLKAVPELNGHNALDFRKQELVCLDELAFADLTQGNGCTWITVISAHAQRYGLKDVKAFFGNLRNGGNYDGMWGCFADDSTVWWGVRNGITFGRFDENNKQLIGSKFELERFYLVAGRMAAGKGTVKTELFVNSTNPLVTQDAIVNPNSFGSKLAIGQERDAVNHPGRESFDGEFARFMIFNRPLTDAELQDQFENLQKTYQIKQ